LQRIYLVKKKEDLAELLRKQIERLEKLKNTERFDSNGGNPEEAALNSNSANNNYAIIKEKEKTTFNGTKSILNWPGIFRQKENAINNELTGFYWIFKGEKVGFLGIFVKNIEKYNGFAFSQDDNIFPRHIDDQ